MNTYDLVVIGGGVSGLTLASRAADIGKAGRSVLLLEAENRVGGCIESWRPRADFWLELGAHTAYNSYGALLAALAARGRLNELLPRKNAGYFFVEDGRTVSPVKRLGLFEMTAHLPFGIFKGKALAPVAGYYAALFGPRNYARLLAPAFAAVLSQSADAYPAAWLFRRKPRLKTAPRKYTFAGGLQGLMEALVENAPFAVRGGCPAQSLERTAEGFAVRAGGELFHARRVAVATPVDVAARLLAPLYPDVAAPLAAVEMAAIETLAVVLPKSKVALPALAGLIGGDDAYFSAVSRDPVPHPELRGFTFHFKPGRLDREGRQAAAARVLGVSPGDFIAAQEKTNRLPVLTVPHLQRMAGVERQLAGEPLALVGNYLNGLSIGDCAERAAREAERLLGQENPD